MTTDALTGCALGLTPDDLSAWRDGAVDAAATARLTAHIPTCAACRSRLAEYDAIAEALRAIRTPEPARGFGHNPRGQVASVERSHMSSQPARRLAPQRHMLSRLGAVAAVVLLLLAFTQVLGRLSVHAPPASGTVTPTARVTATATPAPDALPAFQTVSAANTWGNTGLVARIDSTQISPTENFIPSALLPDGSALVGQITSQYQTTSHLALWNIATGKTTLLNAPGASPMYGGISTDGRYIVFRGASNCQCLSVYDLRAGAVTRQIGISYDAAPEAFDHGIYLRQDLQGGIVMIDVATGQGTDFPDASVANQHARLLAFSWPYVVYMPDPTATTLPNALAVRDLATGQDANLAPLAPLLPDLLPRLKDSQNPGVAVTDGALFVVTAPTPDVNQLYELDGFMGATPTLKPIASVASQYQDALTLHGADTRVLGMSVAERLPSAYDRALGKAVEVSMLGFGTVVTGQYVIAMGPLNAHTLNPYEVAIYDTDKLPAG